MNEIMLDQAPEAMALINPWQDRVVFINQLTCDLLGWDRDELINQRVSRCFKNSLPSLHVFTQAVLHKGSSLIDDITITTADGREIE